MNWDIPDAITFRSDSIVSPMGLAASDQDLFLTYEGYWNGEVYFKFSPDAGNTWSSPTRLTYGFNFFYAFPSIAFCPVSGYIHVVYYYNLDVHYKRGQK